MNAAQGYTVPPHLVNQLAVHLRKSGSMQTVAQAADAAMRAWIAADTPQAPAPAPIPDSADPAPTQGYQWKTLFLPSGTELRMSTRESTCYARVVGDDIIFRSRRVSPRGMTLAIIGDGRNAWRDLWLKFPGEPCFKPASRCRRERERVAAGLNANPAAELIEKQLADLAGRACGQKATEPAPGPENQPTNEPASDTHTIATVAVTMSEALKTMLALMERLSNRVTPDQDRRLNPARRHEDILAGDCALD